ncbi:hypothetical protein [Burkholderia territorii]|uniref:hypothetical protein n=1 Tax=Burkholderia territorii TaxID=1503055 RepID=UPI0012D9024C|nr:hypothetical protein [Burkholderia territorii]
MEPVLAVFGQPDNASSIHMRRHALPGAARQPLDNAYVSQLWRVFVSQSFHEEQSYCDKKSYPDISGKVRKRPAAWRTLRPFRCAILEFTTLDACRPALMKAHWSSRRLVSAGGHRR